MPVTEVPNMILSNSAAPYQTDSSILNIVSDFWVGYVLFDFSLLTPRLINVPSVTQFSSVADKQMKVFVNLVIPTHKIWGAF